VTAREPRSSVLDSTLLALALLLACGVLYALVARLALDGFPYSGDEYSLFLQGDLFAHGLLKAPAPAHAAWLRVDHVIIDDWVHSKYPPGAAALLALGFRAGVPWIVTPIEGVLALTLCWLTIRFSLGRRPALIGLAVLGLAPLYVYQAASFFSHTTSTMFLALGFGSVAAWSRSGRSWWLWLCGVSIGCAYLTRPIDAVLFGLAMIALQSRRALVVAAAGAAPLVALNFLYQKAQFGSLFLDGYHVYQPTFAALYGPTTALNPILPSHIWNPVQLWNHLDIYRAFIIDWTVPGAVLLAIFGAFAIPSGHPARRLRTFSLVLIATYVVALLPMIADVDDGARPRYLSITLIPVAFLAAAGFGPACEALVARFGPRVRTAVVALALIFAPAQLGAFLIGHVPAVWKREGLTRSVAQAGLRDAVVVVRAQHPSRYARNGGLFDHSVLYLSAPATTSGQTVAAAFPGKAIWEAHEGDPWTLTRVR
jgi:hypothetical protein